VDIGGSVRNYRCALRLAGHPALAFGHERAPAGHAGHAGLVAGVCRGRHVYELGGRPAGLERVSWLIRLNKTLICNRPPTFMG
jgi:hypothetical protein